MQFATGTSSVPAHGFKYLQGNDGNVRKFTINSVLTKQSVCPKAHTCFNRIDLPLYASREEHDRFVTMAFEAHTVGFTTD